MSEAEIARFRRWAIIVPILAVIWTVEAVVIAATTTPDAAGDFAIGVVAGAYDVLGLICFAIWRRRF